MKRTTVRIFSFLGAAFLVAAGFIFRESSIRKAANNKLRNIYMNNMCTLGESLYNIDVELKRSGYVTSSEQFGNIATKIYKESGTAENALSQLPNGDADLSYVYKFVSQVGDYALFVSKNAADNTITEEQKENLQSLENTANILWNGVDDMCKRYISGEKMYLDIDSGTLNLSDGIMLSKEDMTDYPTLIYDGPYSDVIEDGKSELLQNAALLSMEEAKSKASEIIGCQADKVTYDGEGTGEIPYYRFYYKNASVGITQKGGYFLWYRKYKKVGNINNSGEDAVSRASEWLKNLTGENFTESYYFTDNGVCTVNFAYREGSTVCYTDLIKVGVALDNGEIVFYDALGYLKNHHARTVETPKIGVEEAKNTVSSKLSINDVKRVLIPKGKSEEIPCYQFACTDGNGKDVLVYINSSTGKEERVALVIKTDSGTLTK